MALVGTLVRHRSASVRAEAAGMFREIAGVHGICLEVHYPVPEIAALAGGDWVNCIPRTLAALGVWLYNPVECRRAAHVQLQPSPGNAITHGQAATPRHRSLDSVPQEALALAPRPAPPLPRQ